MKYYTQHDIALGKLRLKIGKAIEPELAAAILGYGIKMDSPAGSGGVSVPALVGPDAAVEQLRRVGPATGTFECLICGKDTPHGHTGEEVARYHGKHLNGGW